MFSMNLQCCQTLQNIDYRCKRLKQIPKLKIPYCSSLMQWKLISSAQDILCILCTSKCDTSVLLVWYTYNKCVVFLVYYTCSSYTYNTCVKHIWYTCFTDVIQVYILHMYYLCRTLCMVHMYILHKHYMSRTCVLYMYLLHI